MEIVVCNNYEWWENSNNAKQVEGCREQEDEEEVEVDKKNE